MAVDVLVAIVVIVPIASALLAVLTFIVGMVVVSLRGGLVGMHARAQHRAEAREAHDEQVDPCIDGDAPGRDSAHDSACRPSKPAYFPPSRG
jgi:Na+/H+-translocating membrane pyrophosphatase